MGKQHVVNNRILYSFKTEGNSAVCNNMNEPIAHYAKSDVSHRTNSTWSHLYEVCEIVKLTEAERRVVVARVWVGCCIFSYVSSRHLFNIVSIVTILDCALNVLIW